MITGKKCDVKVVDDVTRLRVFQLLSCSRTSVLALR